jgi:hypothetical protein
LYKEATISKYINKYLAIAQGVQREGYSGKNILMFDFNFVMKLSYGLAVEL